MLICKKCKQEIPDVSIYCMYCGIRQQRPATNKRTRANGEGTVEKLPNGKYKAIVTLGYAVKDDGKQKRIVKTKTCSTKKEALAAIPDLKKTQVSKTTAYTFQQLYEKWLPTHMVSHNAINCYKAAFKYFDDISYQKIADIDIDDLQECVDNCPKGKRTKQNMKAVCGLVYKFGIPRNAVPSMLNLAQYIRINDDGQPVHRESFSAEQIEQIKKSIGKVVYADYLYSMIYLGFRPSEFLSIKKSAYDGKNQAIIGGGKTEAGTNRTVTISPKIQNVISEIANRYNSEYLFCNTDGAFITTDHFSKVIFPDTLAAIGIDNPVVEAAGGTQRRKYTPHSCRHTFATLLKGIDAADKDKLELIGHTSNEMLRYYQDVKLDDLKKITDKI